MDTVAFCCQGCKAPLAMTGLEQMAPTSGQHSPSEQELDTRTRPEDSFVWLKPKKQESAAETSGVRSVDESFVILGPLASGNLIEEGDEETTERFQGGGAPNLNDKLKALSRILELASEESGTDHPLCVDCAVQVRMQMENEKRNIETEIADYTEAVKRLESEDEGLYKVSDEEFDKRMQEAEAEFEQERNRVGELQRQVQEAESRMEQLQTVSDRLEKLESGYWHLFNDYSYKMQNHLLEKASIVNRINSATEKLSWLQQTSVCLDAFKIDHQGPFGTISGFRMGRTAEQHVDWDEINAGWGQCVLLLYTLTNLCGFNFSVYRLVPMGSKSKILEKRGTERDSR